MKTYTLAIAPFVLACLTFAQDQPTDTTATPKEAQKIDIEQATYTPKPGETVVKWTFKTPEGFFSEKGCGDVYMLLDFKNTPNTSAHVLNLVKKGFYSGVRIHRVEAKADFALVQWGNPETKKADWDKQKESGSGRAVNREMGPENLHTMGSIGLARTQDPNSGDCQMYACLVPIARLDKDYSVWAHIVAGFNILKYVKVGTEIVAATVVQEGDDAKALLAALPPDVPAKPASDPAVAFADPDGSLKWVTLVGGLRTADVVMGTGKRAVTGNTVKVKYAGWLPDGKEFDSGTYEVQLGAGRVIKGWDNGLVGMQIGGKRKLIIPPGMAYGSAGMGDVIPPNATLIFEIELLEVK